MKIKQTKERNPLEIDKPQQEYQSSWQQWLVLFSFGVLSMANVMQLVCYAPIWNQTAIYYNVNPMDLQWIGNMYYITFFLLAPFCIKPLEWRLDITMHACGVISALGAWVVWFGFNSYSTTLIGLFIIGISDAIILIVPVYISDKWFTIYQRTLSTCIGSFFQYFGMAFAYAFASFYFTDLNDQNLVNRQIDDMSLMIAILNTVGAVLCILFIRNRPSKPASSSDNVLKQNLQDSFATMIYIEEHLIDMVSMGVFIGLGWVYTNIIQNQLYSMGFDQQSVVINGTVYQISPIIIGLWASIKLDNQANKGIAPDYDKYIKHFTTLGYLALLLESFTINYLSQWLIVILNAFIGIGLNAFYPLAIQAFVEKCFPANELLLVTGLLCFANLVGFILNYLIILPVFLNYGLWIGCLTITPCFLHMFFNFKTKFRRFDSSSNYVYYLVIGYYPDSYDSIIDD